MTIDGWHPASENLVNRDVYQVHGPKTRSPEAENEDCFDKNCRRSSDV